MAQQKNPSMHNWGNPICKSHLRSIVGIITLWDVLRAAVEERLLQRTETQEKKYKSQKMFLIKVRTWNEIRKKMMRNELCGAWKCRYWDTKEFFLQWMVMKIRPSVGRQLKWRRAPCHQWNQIQNLCFSSWCIINKMFL